MKKALALLSILLIVISSVFALGGKEESSDTGLITYKVGICNFVDDASLNQICENIQRALSDIEKEKGVKIEVKYDNCNADANVLSQIVANFIADKVDVMVGIATPVAMYMQSATEDSGIPVVFAAVSDPISTGIVSSLENPGANITGTSDFLDTDAIMNLIFALKPEAKKIGLLYDPGQDSSTTPIRAAKDYLNSKGVEYVERMGTTVDEVILATNALIADKVDAIFTPSDNTVMTAELSIYEMLESAGIPHFAGADSFALNGAFLGYGVDYINLGYETGKIVGRILIDKEDPSSIPVLTFDNGTATINTEIASNLGYDINSLRKIFSPYCTKVEEIKTAESFSDL